MIDKFIKSEIRTILVENIYDYVLNDDEIYAKQMKESLLNAYGLCYVNKKNEIELLVTSNKGMTTIGTLYHEAVHAADYLALSKYKKESNVRKLQEDFVFLYWTEFHATYLSYKMLIEEYGYEEDVFSFMEGVAKKVENYLKNNKLLLADATNFFVRVFGEYMAAQETEKECFPKFPIHLFATKNFGRLYNYLYDHKTFESIKDDLVGLESVLKRLEDDSKK